jgi:predicted dehydrogenase
MKEINWGIIGLGEIANKFAYAIKRMEGVKLYAVASRTKEKAEAFGKKYDIDAHKCYGSYDAILNDKYIDAIYVAVPHTMHKHISIMCLNKGKAVLCEKPATINEEELKEIALVAEKNKTFFMEAMKTRFLPVIQEVKTLLDKGTIGEVTLLQADFGFNAKFDPSNRLFDKNLGGGSLLDVGIYNVSFSSFIFGNKPSKISSSLYYGITGVDESAAVNLTYEKGKEALLYSSIKVDSKRDANIIGTEGRITIPRYSNAETAIITVNGKEQKLHMPFEINGFEYEINEVNNCLRENKLQSDIMSIKDSIEVMKIMDKIRS